MKSSKVQGSERGRSGLLVPFLISAATLVAPNFDRGSRAVAQEKKQKVVSAKPAALDTLKTANEAKSTLAIQEEVVNGMRDSFGIELPDVVGLYQMIDTARQYFPVDSLNVAFMKQFLNYQRQKGLKTFDATLVGIIRDWEHYYDTVRISKEPDEEAIKRYYQQNPGDTLTVSREQAVAFIKKDYEQRVKDYVKPTAPEPILLRDEEYGRWFPKPVKIGAVKKRARKRI